VIAIPKIYRWVKLNSNRLVDYLFFQVAFAWCGVPLVLVARYTPQTASGGATITK
jgi:hypothetical protein